MWLLNHGAPAARRWGRILCVGVASYALAACATTSESRNPPKQCSRGSARPANPNGSVFQQAAVSAVPQGSASGRDVMVFGRDGAQADPDNPPADAAVPAPPTAQDRAPAPPPAGRPLSMRRDPASPQLAHGSC